jgi:hypothetical protein
MKPLADGFDITDLVSVILEELEKPQGDRTFATVGLGRGNIKISGQSGAPNL